MAKNTGGVLAALGNHVSYWAPCEEKDRKEVSLMDSVHIYDAVWPYSWHRSKGLAPGLSAGIASIDIIQISGFWAYSAYAASRVARKNKIPYVIRPAGCLEPWRLRNTFFKMLKKKAYLKLICQVMIRNAACLHAVSLREAEHFRLVGYRGSITIIPNGVNTVEFSLGDRKEAEILWPDLKNRQVVLFMSRLSPEKGLDLLIPVWADLIKSGAFEDVLLIIAGPDDRGYRKVVQGMIDRYDMGSRILMTGMVRGQGKLALLRRADVFILPSYSENFGIVVAEALACGTPVITTTGTPWKELEDVDAGRWVPPRKPELYQALRELMDKSEPQRKAMGHRGRRLVLENYNWDKIARQFLTVYSCILQGKDIPLHPKPFSDNVVL